MTILCTTTHSKMSRDEQLFSLLDATKKTLATDELVDVSRVGDAFWGNVHHCMQELVLERGIRYNIEIEVPECMHYIPSIPHTPHPVHPLHPTHISIPLHPTHPIPSTPHTHTLYTPHIPYPLHPTHISIPLHPTPSTLHIPHPLHPTPLLCSPSIPHPVLCSP